MSNSTSLSFAGETVTIEDAHPAALSRRSRAAAEPLLLENHLTMETDTAPMVKQLLLNKPLKSHFSRSHNHG